MAALSARPTRKELKGTMTKQEMFDKVVAHARAQKRRSLDIESGNCLYRGHNGTKCFIGALIPDEKYDPYMDKLTMSANTAPVREAAGYEGHCMSYLATQLQGIHDNCAVEDWEEKLKSVAKDFELIYTPPHEHLV